MQTFIAHFTHKISPKNTDVSEQFDLPENAIDSLKTLGALLRKQRILQPGQRINYFKLENGEITIFPMGGIWHSITLKPVSDLAKLEKTLCDAVEGHFWRSQVRNKLSMSGINLDAVRAAIESEGAEAAAADLCRGCFRT